MNGQNPSSGSLSPKLKRCDAPLIYEKDLREAIAECQGKRNPDANTCIKLAAYYTLLQNMYPSDDPPPAFYQAASGDSGAISYDTGTEFSKAVNGRPVADVLPVIDELMTTLQVLHPRLYDGVLNKL